MRINHPLTPTDVSPAIQALCKEIAPGTSPVYVDVHPLSNMPVNECFPLVDAHVATAGGEALVGWSLWEMPTIFVEAEFHAVWKSPNGDLVDIAPKASPTQRVLFLPDETRRYEGQQVDNIRRAVTGDPTVKAYLDTFSDQFRLMNRGERAGQHGEIHLLDEEAREYARLQVHRERLYFQLHHKFPSFGPYSPCWCGSGKKVKWCHGVQSLTNPG